MGMGGGDGNAKLQQQLNYTALALLAQGQKQAEANSAVPAWQNAIQAETNNQINGKHSQRRVKLSVLDAIKTTSRGLLNEPKTGRLTLLGN